MGEYADDYFRDEVKKAYDFDPGSMYIDTEPRIKPKCPKCGKVLKTSQGVQDHMRDIHGGTNETV